jgi:hypothetical protein
VLRGSFLGIHHRLLASACIHSLHGCKSFHSRFSRQKNSRPNSSLTTHYPSLRIVTP